MSVMACEIVGTGDGRPNGPMKIEENASKTIANDIVLEIVDNALNAADEAKSNPEDEIDEDGKAKAKSATPLRGTGDQRSNEALEPVIYHHPPVEKKNRLTDLVKNSKQVLARLMMSDSKLILQQEDKREEQIVDVIELDCIKDSDLPFKIPKKAPRPEEVPLPQTDSDLDSKLSEELLDEIGLGSHQVTANEKRMTFPRTSGSRAKAAFVAKCRTLKREATNLKKKKWDVSGKIVNFFRKKRSADRQDSEKRIQEQKKKEP